MSTKASITAGERHHLYFQEYLKTEPKNVFFELIRPREFSISKETTRDGVIDNLVVEIPPLRDMLLPKLFSFAGHADSSWG